MPTRIKMRTYMENIQDREGDIALTLFLYDLVRCLYDESTKIEKVRGVI